MIPASLPLIVATALLTLLAALMLAWGWHKGFFSNLEQQALVIFEPRDWRLERPWETEPQHRERLARHGDPLAPEKGEWGGAR